MKKLRVFVSSTSQLAEERSRLDAELPRAVFDLSLFEQAGARGVSPESRCRQEIEDSDAMVGILGPDYGSLFPGRSTSIVEWEHDTAEHLGRECLDFVKNLAPGAARDPRQEAFIAHRREFRNGQWVKFYDTPGDFVATARASLEGWLVDFLRMVDKRLKPWKGSVRSALTALAVTIVLLLVATAVIPGAGLTSKAMITFSVAVEVAVALCFVGVLRFTGGSHE
jgi:hypothetical protein